LKGICIKAFREENVAAYKFGYKVMVTIQYLKDTCSEVGNNYMYSNLPKRKLEEVECLELTQSYC